MNFRRFYNFKFSFQRSFLILLGFLFLINYSQAQELRNIWIGGPSTTNSAGVYGTKGVADPTNIPPARSNGMTWVSDGNFYLFGGLDDNGDDYFNDFWKWDGTNWTYLAGAQGPVNDVGSGTLGQADPNNIPSARVGSATWVDKNGDLFLFSGHVQRQGVVGLEDGYSNDIWKWKDGWILVSGNSSLNNPQSPTSPGGLKNAITWYDGGKYVYLLGGDVGSLAYLNSLYRMDLDSLTWSLLKNNPEEYGTKLAENTSNNPPPIAYGGSWYDEGNECLMLFGGAVLDFTVSPIRIGSSNTIWKFNIGTNNWTWVSGDSTLNQSTVYSNADPSLINPGSRSEFPLFIDGAGMIYLFGGRSASFGFNNDLWRWDNSKWEFIGGSQSGNSSGNFASLGYSNSNSIPSRRNSLGFFYDNEFYVFGGNRSGTNRASNDFWKMEYGYFYENQGSGASWFPNSPSDSANVYIREDFPPSGQGAFSLTGKNLFIETGAELDLEKRSESDFDAFSLSGDLVLDGSLIGEGLLKFTGEGIHEIIGSQDLEYFGVLELDSNAVLKTNEKLSLGATANSFGQLVYSNGENEVLDSITMETWLDLQGTTDNARYFYLNSPLEGVSLVDFGKNGGYINFSNDANFCSVYQYNPTSGWDINLGLFSSIIGKIPAAFYAGHRYDTTFLKLGGEAGTISIKGVSGKNNGSGLGSTLSLVYNNGQSHSSNFIGSGSLAETEGWNFAPNVFPSYFDLKESFDNSQNVRKTAYVWNGVDYSTYTENGSGTGLTTNGGDRYLKPFVPYFVQVENVSSSSISIGRHVSSGVGFKTYSTSAKKSHKSDAVHIFLKNKLGENENDAWVGFNSSASSGFDGGMDAWKIFGNPEKAALYSRSSNLNFAVNILSSEEEIHEIPVFVDFDTAHGQNLSLDFELGELETYNSLWLEDMALSKFTDLSHSPHYNFTYDSTALSPRFRLHFSRKHIDLEEEEIGFYSYKDENGQFQLVFGEEQNNSQIRIYDASGKLVEELEFSGSRIKLSPLAAKGLYIIQLEGQAGVFSQKIMN